MSNCINLWLDDLKLQSQCQSGVEWSSCESIFIDDYCYSQPGNDIRNPGNAEKEKKPEQIVFCAVTRFSWPSYNSTKQIGLLGLQILTVRKHRYYSSIFDPTCTIVVSNEVSVDSAVWADSGWVQK